ncbi:MAG TPA: carbohydrate ABC transporter permease [Trebonia sp.]|jgi:multiple sugar transport system permease protein|nr:carbohydrate ABC transporter permease [Trebonia sp.]
MAGMQKNADTLGTVHLDRLARPVAVAAARKNPGRRRRTLGSIGKHAVLIALGVTFIFPLLWMILTSVKPLPQAVTFPPVWIPHPLDVPNYPQALSAEPFASYFFHTLYYCVTTVVGVLVSGSLVAYGFSRIKWPGRDTLFYVMVATMLLPFIVTLIPLFVLYKEIGWVGSYNPLIIPTFFGSSVFSTFLLRQFFMTIPETLSDAARIDGANEFVIFTRIILPLAKPALATIALFQFIYAWNDFLGPLIYLDKSSLYPISIGLSEFLGQYTTNWPWLMAASTVATLPMIALFFLTQKTFIQGITLTGTKG